MRGKVAYWSVTLLLVFASLFFNMKILYLLFAVQAVIAIARSHSLDLRTFWIITVWSMILPDNYSCTLLLIVAALYSFIHLRKGNAISKNYMRLLGLYAAFLVATTLINKVPKENVIMGLLYFSSMIVLALLINCPVIYELIDDISEDIDKFLNVELFATALKIIFYLAGIVSGSDWSTGTFGKVQQTQLFIVSLLGIFWDISYRKRKNPSERTISLRTIAFLIAIVSTNCWAIFFASLVGVVLGVIINMKPRSVLLVGIGLALVAVIFSSGKFIPKNVSNQMNKIVENEAYRNYRFNKWSVYENTYSNIPSKDKQFALIGNGFGNYASRGALTCTGEYIDSYSKIMNIKMSDYTAKYIYPSLHKAKLKGKSDYGSVLARPNSTLIALMGETGFIGIALFVLLMIAVFAKTDKFGRIAAMGFLGTCFFENFMEYSRIVMILMFILILANQKYKKEKESDVNKAEETFVC